MIEPLEPRRLCAAVRHAHPVFSLNDGTLSVSGSVGNDVIEFGSTYVSRLKLMRNTLSLNGKVYSFRVTAITKLIIYGGEGKDHITNTVHVRSKSGFASGVLIDGGAGNDNLYTSYGPDTLLGGGGNDVLARVDGNGVTQCYMDGGPGDDRLSYGTTMYGGGGYDTATLSPTATADYNDYPYVGLVTTGGIEQYENTRSPYFEEYPNLSSRGGNLVLNYRPLSNDQSISAPTVRDDGKIAVTVRIDHSNPVTRPDDTLWTVRFNAAQTTQAKQNGLLLIIKRADIGTITFREILIPQGS